MEDKDAKGRVVGKRIVQKGNGWGNRNLRTKDNKFLKIDREIF
jgi:hypothetical protein